jgi:hypothetical protein
MTGNSAWFRNGDWLRAKHPKMPKRRVLARCLPPFLNPRVLLGSLTVACVLGVTCPGHAVLITVNGTRQFYDDFENASPGSNPDTGKNRGHWTIQGTTSPVSNNAVPGPAQGRQYLSYERAVRGKPGWYNGLAAHLETEQCFDNLKIHAEWMMYIPSAAPATYRGTVIFKDGSNNIRTILILGEGATGKVEYRPPNGKDRSAALTYTPDTWQKWTMDYTVGEPKFTFSIGNSPQETVDAYTVGGVAFMEFCGNSNSGSVFYLDAVEREPATTDLLLTDQEHREGVTRGASAAQKQ